MVTPGYPRKDRSIQGFQKPLLSRKHAPKHKFESFRNKIQTHTSILMWKAYLQRQRRWRLLAIESFIAVILFLIAIFIAKPVFLTTIEAEPEAPLSEKDILETLNPKTILGFAPDEQPYETIMEKAAFILNSSFMSAASESKLNDKLYTMSQGSFVNNPVVWIIWEPQKNNKWSFFIRSTERARYNTDSDSTQFSNPHLSTGFLAVQVAVSQAIVEFVTLSETNYELNLITMPVSPLMQESLVRKSISFILLCYTLAFLPAVLETEALVVWETENNFKRALRMRDVSFASMYISWLVYTYLTALPVCMLGAITIILIFRWIHLITALLTLLAYVSVMAMMALIMAMFHDKPYIACIWTTLFTLLQTYLAELMVHHRYDSMHVALTFLLHVLLPPLGLINAFNEFALLSTGRKITPHGSVFFMVVSWGLLIVVYFVVLMLLQRTLGEHRAIGGQVPWKSVLFKQTEDEHTLHPIQQPTRAELGRVQEVDELLAIAISFRDVCKNIMGHPVLKNITFDIYRGEYTIMYSEKVQEQLIDTLDDLLTGLAEADHGEVRIMGDKLTPKFRPLNKLYTMGYCHRSETLVDDLTVQEHFTLFSTICLWNKNSYSIMEYSQIRIKHLLKECNLIEVRHTRVRDLGVFYRAQLCWALAKLLEPRVIIVPYFKDEQIYRSVIIDKIMQFRKHMTIISLNHSSLHLEFGDRVFVFDSNILVFGGTPAYMFFRFGREYRIRLVLRANSVIEDDNATNDLIERVHQAGGTVRGHLGSLLVLKIPAIPSAPVASLIKDLTDNSTKYGLTPSLSVSVADSEEVVTRAVHQIRAAQFKKNCPSVTTIKAALKQITEPRAWKRNKSCCNIHFCTIVHKFLTFHKHHKVLFFLTVLVAFISGLLLGKTLTSILLKMEYIQDHDIHTSEVLTVETLGEKTIMVMRVDNSSAALSIAEAYVMSETNATQKEVKQVFYVAFPRSENIIEYLVSRAIHAPQHYVYVYAYGMDVETIEIDSDQLIVINALYSPLHHDQAAAARSIARVYMALIRHYTGQLDATIQVHDDPFTLDLIWMKELTQPPLFFQLLLILTICHITVLPSMEHGLIRHIQAHAMNFSPLRYWFTLYLCDLIFFCLLAGLMCLSAVAVMYISLPHSLFQYSELLILPCMLVLYGVGCVPQAYIFSLGSQVALNTSTFIIFNMIFGETTILAKIFYGDFLSYAIDFMSLSPQFNMAYAFVKIRSIFLYNTECSVFQRLDFCSTNSLHKCCEKCGVLQECFSRRQYLTYYPGILMEAIALVFTAFFFICLLLLFEYRIFHLLWTYISRRLYIRDKFSGEMRPGTEREKNDVLEKINGPRPRRNVKVNTFGEYLCVKNVARRESGQYIVRNVYLGLGKGEALAVSGLKRHGRLELCEIISGFKIPADGNALAMSKWKLNQESHMYSRQISIGCERASLPSWLSVKDALMLIGVLRGVPTQHVQREALNLIQALDLVHLSSTLIKKLNRTDAIRVHFASAMIAAPPVVILDEVCASQRFMIRRAMYTIVSELRKKGHAILTASSTIENNVILPSKLAFFVDGTVFDVDTIDKLVERYTPKGHTVVVHIMDEVDVNRMFARYFYYFKVNDISEVLINVQVYDDLNFKMIFEKMETLQAENYQVYSYIITATTINYVYNSILSEEKGTKPATGLLSCKWAKKIMSSKPKVMPKEEDLLALLPFERKYDITSLKELPWSVIFHSSSSSSTTAPTPVD